MNNLSIVKIIRKFVGRNTCVEVRGYCCPEIKDFIEWIKDNTHVDTCVSIDYCPKGLELRIDNTRMMRHMGMLTDSSRYAERDFIMTFCPFCGGKIVYHEETQDISEGDKI